MIGGRRLISEYPDIPGFGSNMYNFFHVVYARIFFDIYDVLSLGHRHFESSFNFLKAQNSLFIIRSRGNNSCTTQPIQIND